MPGNHNKKEIKTDIRNFETKIELKSFFWLENQDKPNENNSTSSDIPNSKPKSISEKAGVKNFLKNFFHFFNKMSDIKKE